MTAVYYLADYIRRTRIQSEITKKEPKHLIKAILAFDYQRKQFEEEQAHLFAGICPSCFHSIKRSEWR